MSPGAEDREGAAASSPGASAPGDPGYGGRATVGDEGAAAGPESFGDPFGRPEPGEPDPRAAS
jgi:hypothetical protein